MGFNLREFLNLNNKDKQKKQPQPASTATPVIQSIQNAKYGVLANNPQKQQELIRNTQPSYFNPVKAGVGAAYDFVKSIPAGAVNTVQVPYSLTRLAAANTTGNNVARANAQKALNSDTQNNLFSPDVPFLKSVSATVLNPVSDIYSRREVNRATRELTPAYRNMYGAYGLNPNLGQNQADVEASNIKQAFLQDQLKRAGLSQNDSLARTSLKIGAQAGQFGANNLFLANTGNGIVNNLLGRGVEKAVTNKAGQSLIERSAPVVKDAALGGATMAGTNVLGVAQQDNPTATDYLKAAAQGVTQGALLSGGLELGAKGLGAAGRALKPSETIAHNNLLETNPEYAQLQSQLEQSTKLAGTSTSKLAQNAHLKNIDNIQKQMIDMRKNIQQGGYIGVPSNKSISKTEIARQKYLAAQRGEGPISTEQAKAYAVKELVNNKQEGGLPDSIKIGKNDKFYHGTTQEDAASIVKSGFNPSLSKGKLSGNQESPYALFASKDSGSLYGDHSASTYGNTTVELKPKSNAVMLDGNSQTWLDTMGRSKSVEESAMWADKLRKMGYDGIIEPNGETTVLNSNKFNFNLPENKLGLTKLNDEGFVKVPGVKEKPIIGPDLSKSKIPELKTRGFIETIFKDEKTPTKVKQQLIDLDTSYQSHNMKELQTRAANLIKTNPDIAARIAKSGEGDLSSMVGSELIKHYGQTKQYQNAIEMADVVARNATKYGQANAALAAYAKLTPEGVLRFTQRELQRFNKETGKNIELTTEKAKTLQEKASALNKMKDGYKKEVATQELLKEIYTTFPSTWSQKISTMQTMAQLLNPKTLIRNVGGNTIFGGLENVSQSVATPLDIAVSKITGKRTTSLPSFKTQSKAGLEGLKKGYSESVKGVNTGPNTQFELPNVPTFRGKFGGTLEKGLNIGLRATDRAAYEAAYTDSLRSQMKAAKVKEPTPKMIEEATHTGLYRTFQDDTVSSRFFVGMKKSLNNIGVGIKGKRFGLGDIVLKYPKTPGNLLARGLDYSPVGFVKGIFEASKPLFGKEFNQKAFVDTFSRAITGSTASFGLGYVLSDAGIITASPKQDKDLRNLQKASGLGGYQINASAFKRWVASGFDKNEAKLRKGDKLVSYDWAQPIAIPLSAGAALGTKEPKESSSVVDNIGNSANTLVEQPLLQGVQKAFGSNKNTGGVTGAITETAKGIPSSFTPTAVSQVNQAIDNSQRITSNSNPIIESVNLVKAKVPGLAQTLPKNYTVLGKPSERYQGGSNNLFNVFLNPAFMSNYNPDEAAQLPIDIYDKTGETKQVPRTVPNKVKINDTTKELTGSEMSKYQKYVGEKTSTAYKGLINNPEFQKLSDVEKANKLSTILSNINAAAKIELFGDKGFGTDEYDPSKLDKGVREILGGKVPTYTPPVAKSSKSKSTSTRKTKVASKTSTKKSSSRSTKSKINYSSYISNTFKTSANNQSALRNLIRQSTIKRRKITK